MIQERRQYQRLVPDSPTPIHLGKSGSVLLFDVSEGGVGVGCPATNSEDQTISLPFDLPGAGDHIQARAEIVWTSDSRYRAGFRFLDLTDASRLQLRDWISSKAYDTAQAPVALPENEATSSAIVSQNTGTVGSSISPDWQEEELARLRAALASSSWTRRLQFAPSERRSQTNEGSGRLRLRRTVGLCLAIVVFVPVCLFLGHLLGNMGHNTQATKTTMIAKAYAPAPKVGGSIAEPSVTANLGLPPPSPWDLPGFVLQVGAMTHEINADNLRRSLEQNNFPAFVFRRSTGRFYRVAVGPYGDADTAARVKDKLKGLGFEAILKRWSPE